MKWWLGIGYWVSGWGLLAFGGWLLVIGVLSGCAAAEAPLTINRQELTANSQQPIAAPDFALVALDGGMVRLGEQGGRWVLLNFWATWCEPCKTEMPLLQDLADQYAAQLVVLGINQRESVDEVRAFADAYSVRFPLLLNPDDATLMNYGVMGLPLTFVINPVGEIVARQFGVIDAAFVTQLAAWLEA
jgi:thiol-disulfide isomerase/thioredoxin